MTNIASGITTNSIILNCLLLSTLFIWTIAQPTNSIQPNQLIQVTIEEASYSYYTLQLSEVDNIEEVKLYSTTLWGNTIILASTEVQQPKIWGQEKDHKPRIGRSSITISGRQLKNNLHIGLYALKSSEVVLGISVLTKQHKKIGHTVPLEPRRVQQYTLSSNSRHVNFIVNAQEKQEISMHINTITGKTKLSFQKENGKAVECKYLESDPSRCSFTSETDGLFNIVISSEEAKETVFSVVYTIGSLPCLPGHLNRPEHFKIPSHSSQCRTFTLQRPTYLLFSSSLSSQQILSPLLVTQLSANDHFMQPLQLSSKVILPSQLAPYCPLTDNRAGYEPACTLQLHINNSADASEEISLILSEQQEQMMLFEGIPGKVDSFSLSQKARHFYYHVRGLQPIRVHLRSHNPNTPYYMATNFQTPSSFLQHIQTDNQIYPSFFRPDHKPRTALAEDEYQTSLERGGLSSIIIPSDSIKKNCHQQCYLLISVSHEPSHASNEADRAVSYVVEVSQREIKLALGESRMGWVGYDQFITYTLPAADATLAIRTTDPRLQSCFSFSLYSSGSAEVQRGIEGTLTLKQTDQYQRLEVVGHGNGVCSFEVTYISIDFPIHNAQLSRPYSVSLTPQKPTVFLYHHGSYRSWRVVEMGTTGTLNIAVHPLSHENTVPLKQLIEMKKQQYEWKGQAEGQFVIRQTLPNFCVGCFYLIHASTPDHYEGQILVLRAEDPIPLTTHHFLKEKLAPPKIAAHYIFHSISSFEVTVNLLQGQLHIEITDPEGKLVHSKQITNTDTLRVQMDSSITVPVDEFYARQAQYHIRATTTHQANYHIQVNRQHPTTRLFEGYPSRITLKSRESVLVEFYNSNKEGLNLMVQSRFKQAPDINFTVSGRNSQGTSYNPHSIDANITESQGAYLVKLKSSAHVYSLQLNCARNTELVLLLGGGGLTYLTPRKSHLIEGEGKYELPGQGGLIVEVGTCKNQPLIELRSTTNEKPEPRVITNGHHRILSVPPSKEMQTYQLRVRKQSPGDSLLYQVKYYPYQGTNPYELIRHSDQQTQTFNKGNQIKVRVQPPTLPQNEQFYIGSIEYLIYAWKIRDHVADRVQCGKKQDELLQIMTQNAQYLLNDYHLKQIKGDDTELKQLYIAVQAEVELVRKTRITASTPSIPKLTLSYSTSNIALHSHSDLTLTKMLLFAALFVLILVPIIYYSFQYILRKFGARPTQMTEEEDIQAAASQTNPTANVLKDKTGAVSDAPLKQTM